MKLHIIKTGSKGNCYLIESENSFLILEAGATIKEIQKYFLDKKIKFSLSNVIGCLITHEHGDHAKYSKEYLQSGIELFMSAGTNEAVFENKKTAIFTLKNKESFQAQNFFIVPVTSFHDAKEPLNFIIRILDKTIVYITDTGFVPFDFNFVCDLLICEVNHSQNELEENFSTGKLHPVLFDRIQKNHLSKEQVFKLLENNKGKVRQLCAVHLSNDNIEKLGLESEFIKKFGVVTSIAEKGKEVYF